MSHLKLFSWNVNGIRAAHSKGTIVEFFNSHKPTILCIQETKAQSEQIPEDIKTLDGYHTFFTAAEKKGYSGVGIFSKIEPLKVTNGLGIDKFDSEGRTIIAEYNDFVLFNIYYPNGKASSERFKYKLEFYDAFLEKVEKIKAKKKNIVICGDVNTAHKEIDLARPKENEKVSGFLPEERAWMDKFIEQGYLDTLRLFNQGKGQYSWWDLKSRARERNVGWRIDYFFVSESLKENVKSAGVYQNVLGSDHCPVGIELEF